MKKKEADNTNRNLNRVIFVLSIVGVAIAIYVLQSFLRQSSIVCVNEGCELVRKHSASYLFGIPIPGYGLVGYTLLALLSFVRTIQDKRVYLRLMLGVSGFGVGFVLWFTWTELFVIGAVCTWCAVSAVNMIVLFFLAVQSYRLRLTA